MSEAAKPSESLIAPMHEMQHMREIKLSDEAVELTESFVEQTDQMKQELSEQYELLNGIDYMTEQGELVSVLQLGSIENKYEQPDEPFVVMTSTLSGISNNDVINQARLPYGALQTRSSRRAEHEFGRITYAFDGSIIKATNLEGEEVFAENIDTILMRSKPQEQEAEEVDAEQMHPKTPERVERAGGAISRLMKRLNKR